MSAPFALTTVLEIVAHKHPHVGEAPGVVADDAAVIGGFVQLGAVLVHIAGHENAAGAHLPGAPVDGGDACGFQRQRGVFQSQVADVGAAAGGGQQPVEAFVLQRDVCRAGRHDHGVTFAPCIEVTGAQRHRQGIAEDLARRGLQGRVGQGADTVAAAVQPHAHAQAVQRLSQFEADDTRAHHGHRTGQVLPVEHVVVDDQALTQAFAPCCGDGRAGAGGDDDSLGLHTHGPHLQGVVVDEAGVTLQPVFFRPVVDGVDDKADKAVALAAHTRHHGAAVHPQRPTVHAEAPRVSNRMGRLGSGDQQLAGHAAHPRAGGTINTALDGQHLGRVGQRGAVGRHAGGAGADDGDVGVDRSFCVHGIACAMLTGPDRSGRDGRRGAALAANGTCGRQRRWACR